MLGLVIALAGCGGGEDTAGARSFAEIEAEVLGPSCTMASCHGSGAMGGLELVEGEMVEALVEVPSEGAAPAVLVVPGDVEGSYLLAKLRGDSGIVGEPMPVGGSLVEADMADLVAWVERGAPDD